MGERYLSAKEYADGFCYTRISRSSLRSSPPATHQPRTPSHSHHRLSQHPPNAPSLKQAQPDPPSSPSTPSSSPA